MDDDGDGHVDCADPDCDAGYACAPTVPAGWSGPVALWQGAGSSNPPTCSSAGGYPTETVNATSGLSASPAVCPGCSCGSPKGVSCQVAAASFYGNNSCAGGAGSLNIVQGICQGFISLSLDPSSVRWQSATSGGGACLPIPSSLPVVPPLEWASRARVCANPAAGGGCWAAACVPRPSPPFAQAVCVYQNGDISCPGTYNQKLVYYQGAVDNRSCTGCDCQPPTGTSCSGTLKLWTDLNCQVDETTLTSVGQCAQLGPDPTPPSPPYQTLRSIRYSGGPSGSGSCASLPSTTTGSASPAAPVTFCCTAI